MDSHEAFDRVYFREKYFWLNDIWPGVDTREGGEDVTLSSRMVIQTCEVKCLVGVYKVDKWDVAMMDTGEPNLSDHRLEYTTCVNHPYPQAIHNSFSH